ncbi:MAG: 50S ribosomal protein L24 [Candidatus Pacearchaeota archaeon]
MPVCSYCQKNYKNPRGLTFVLSNGDILYFCSSKCKKNHDLGRKQKKIKWIIKKKKGEKQDKTIEEQEKAEVVLEKAKKG